MEHFPNSTDAQAGQLDDLTSAEQTYPELYQDFLNIETGDPPFNDNLASVPADAYSAPVSVPPSTSVGPAYLTGLEAFGTTQPQAGNYTIDPSFLGGVIPQPLSNDYLTQGADVLQPQYPPEELFPSADDPIWDVQQTQPFGSQIRSDNGGLQFQFDGLDLNANPYSQWQASQTQFANPSNFDFDFNNLASANDQLNQQTDQPAQQTNQPAQQIGQPAQQIGQPAQQIGQPAQQIGQPAQQIGQPAQQIGQPAQQIGQPAQQIGQPAQQAGSRTDPNTSTDPGANTSRNVSRTKAKRRTYQPEAPKRDPRFPHVRPNSNTKGNTRTGKINNFGNGQYLEVTPHPLGFDAWVSPATGNVFRYNEFGEFKDECFDAGVLEDYLLNHPFSRPGYSGPGKLILWIQNMPGDSAKRSPTKLGGRCRLRDCPCKIYPTRTINTGAFRVAFDEQWSTYGAARNPFHVAGYVHLYCMERFMDFVQICRHVDIRADDRIIPSEPTNKFEAGLARDGLEYNVAKNFIDLVQTGQCHCGNDPDGEAQHWMNYPVHANYAPGAPKVHESTLTRRLVQAKIDTTGEGKKNDQAKRANPQSMRKWMVNKGDLQAQVDAQQAERSAQAAAGKATKAAKKAQKLAQGEGNATAAAAAAAPAPAPAPATGKRKRRGAGNASNNAATDSGAAAAADSDDESVEDDGALDDDPDGDYKPPTRRRRRS